MASALEIGNPQDRRRCIQHEFLFWLAGYNLNRGNTEAAGMQIEGAARHLPPLSLSGMLSTATADRYAKELEREYPLSEADAKAIAAAINEPEELAQELVQRFSPKWFLGWRDICRSTDIRTLIASAVPRVAVGHKFMLMFALQSALRRICLEGILNSMIVDYCARQKLGGTSFSYFVIRQLPVLPPATLGTNAPWSRDAPIWSWLLPRVLELVYTAHDLTALARDCGYDGLPFVWDDGRRFEIRCELDAAFFHLYLPSDDAGPWRRADGETPEQLAALTKHFPTPRDAVAYILDQFPIVREKDEKAHGRYRTKDRILEIYDAMLAAQRTGTAYQTRLTSPPGVRSTP